MECADSCNNASVTGSSHTYFQEHSGASYSDGFTFFGVGASQGIGINLKTLNRNIDAQTEFGHSKSTLTIGTTDNPAPIHLELMPLFKVVDKNMWGSAWDENVMASKKKNLIRALELYPNQTDAHLEKGIIWNGSHFI